MASTPSDVTTGIAPALTPLGVEMHKKLRYLVAVPLALLALLTAAVPALAATAIEYGLIAAG